jgi:hypothetical protein
MGVLGCFLVQRVLVGQKNKPVTLTHLADHQHSRSHIIVHWKLGDIISF